MAVSRFLKSPILTNLSEKDFSHHSPFCRVLVPSGVGGYVRGRRTPRGRRAGRFPDAYALGRPLCPAAPGGTATPWKRPAGARGPLQGGPSGFPGKSPGELRKHGGATVFGGCVVGGAAETRNSAPRPAKFFLYRACCPAW